MFCENDWEDDGVKTYKFKSFTKNQPTSSKTKATKMKTKKKHKLENNETLATQGTSVSIIKSSQKQMKTAKKKLKNKIKQPIEENSTLTQPQKSGENLVSKLRNNLKGSRFRFLNEQLYTMEGSSGLSLFNDSPEAFEAYHSGYRHQVAQWPMNPLRKIIGEVKKLPQNLVIADFGCGDAILAQSVPHKVYSIDLVSVKDDVIACDMANTPLKTGSIDVAVYCLSLMGVNLQDFFLEANRLLRMGGLLIIAEISSRFSSIDAFIRSVTCCGFQLERRELSHKMFVFFRFKKYENILKGSKVTSFSLKPCLYKKR